MKSCRHVCALAVLAACQARAQPSQQLPPEIQARISTLSQSNPSEWLKGAVKIVIPWLHEQLWPVAKGIDGRLSGQPGVLIRMEVAEDAPFIESGSIVFPGLFVARTQLAGYIVSHDVFVDSGRTFPVPDSVLERAYAESTVLKSLAAAPLNPRDSPMLFSNLLNFITCYSRDPQCAAMQNQAWSAALTFFLAHEYGHLAAGDSGDREYQYSVSKEEAADAFALKVLRAFNEDRYADNATRDITLLSAAGVLILHAATLPDGAARNDIGQRVAALVNLLPRDTQRRYENIATSSGDPVGMSSLTLTWDNRPEWIAIDGLSYEPDELQGKTLKLTADLHQIVSVGPDGLAYSGPVLMGGSTTLHLRFQPFAPGPLGQDELARMKKSNDWGRIIRGTATPQLRPREASVALALFEALDWCGLGRLINPSLLPPDTSASDRGSVERWLREGKPMWTWRP